MPIRDLKNNLFSIGFLIFLTFINVFRCVVVLHVLTQLKFLALTFTFFFLFSGKSNWRYSHVLKASIYTKLLWTILVTFQLISFTKKTIKDKVRIMVYCTTIENRMFTRRKKLDVDTSLAYKLIIIHLHTHSHARSKVSSRTFLSGWYDVIYVFFLISSSRVS